MIKVTLENWNAGVNLSSQLSIIPVFPEVSILRGQVILASYIVRIYRFGKDNSRNPVEVVEETGVKGKNAFTNYDELWEILNLPKGITARKRTGDTRAQGERR